MFLVVMLAVINPLKLLSLKPNSGKALLCFSFLLASACGQGASSPSTTVSETASWPHELPVIDSLAEDRETLSIKRGLALLTATKDSLPHNVGNSLNCTSCHLDGGIRKNGLPWIGVMGRFPQFRARNAKINFISDRVNDCLERSMAGTALAEGSDELNDIIAYFTFLSRDVQPGVRISGQGAPRIGLAGKGDRIRGSEVFRKDCARCHGVNGEGSVLAPPVWGEGSYNNGAGMGRPRTAAAFIRANMPHDTPGKLSERQALDVAAYINDMPRQVFEGGPKDWPVGGAPEDVPYATKGRFPTP